MNENTGNGRKGETGRCFIKFFSRWCAISKPSTTSSIKNLSQTNHRFRKPLKKNTFVTFARESLKRTKASIFIVAIIDHDKVGDKIRSKKFERCSRIQQEKFLSNQIEDTCDDPENHQRLFGSNIECSTKIDTISPVDTTQATDKSVLVYTVCSFVAKNKGGLKCHMKKHMKFDQITTTGKNELRSLHECIALYKQNTKLLNQIPKGARATAADMNNDMNSWRKLFLFSYTSLVIPEKDDSVSLTTAVKKNINAAQNDSQPPLSRRVYKSKPISTEDLARFDKFFVRGRENSSEVD